MASWGDVLCTCLHKKRQHDSQPGKTGRRGYGRCQVYWCGCNKFAKSEIQTKGPVTVDRLFDILAKD